MKATYKVLDHENNVHITVDSFEAACELKGINTSKGKPARRTFRTLQADRMNTDYPVQGLVDTWFIRGELSSQKATIAYIKMMYGIKAKVVAGRVVY